LRRATVSPIIVTEHGARADQCRCDAEQKNFEERLAELSDKLAAAKEYGETV
jgi:hypothetical protein